MGSDITITIDAKDSASKILDGLLGRFGSMGRIIKDLGSGDFAGAAMTGLNSLIDLQEKAVKLAAEHQDIMTRLAQTLESTGRVADISAGQLEFMASGLQQVTGIDDESILAAYNAIAKFADIPTDAMDDISLAAANMSAALGGDLATNADNIARVLETGLIPRTWGFNDALKDQIAKLIEDGDKAGALTLILDELNTRYGGQAAAQLDTYNGQLKLLGENFDDLLEALATAQLGPEEGILGVLNDIIGTLVQLQTLFNEIGKFHTFWLLIGNSGIFKNIPGLNGNQIPGAPPPAGSTPVTGSNGQTVNVPNVHGGHAAGGAFAGWGMVGDAPGGRITPYTEWIYAPGGAQVFNQSQIQGFAGGGQIPPTDKAGKNITIINNITNPVREAAEESISRELVKLAYLGVMD